MLRVLYIINDLRVGGAEVLTKDLAPRLRGDGITVEVAALRPADSFVQEALLQSGVPTTFGPDSLRFVSPRHIALLARRMRGFDLVHVQLFPAQLWAALAAARLPAAERPILVTTEHNTYNRRRSLPLARVLDDWMYRRYRAIVAISPATADALAAWIPATAPKTRVIQNAVDVERVVAAAPAERDALVPGLDAATPLLVCVGRLEPQKDHATLLRALPHLPGVHIALVGGGDLEATIRQQAAALGVSDRVHLLGRRSDVPSILKTATLYVQPSQWEGFGIAAVEAMACGIPVVVSDVPGLREVVGDAGLRFPAQDSAALAKTVQQVLADPALARRLATAGRQRAELFRMERFVEEHRALYRELVGTTSSAR